MLTEDPIVHITRDLVEEVMLTALAMDDVLGSLIAELPDDAFPGEDKPTSSTARSARASSTPPGPWRSGATSCRSTGPRR
jgi:hypothetical protein